MSDECLCIGCCIERRKLHPIVGWGDGYPAFRYACEICGNKRCPHHSDHRLDCTNSNEPGQAGSIYE